MSSSPLSAASISTIDTRTPVQPHRNAIVKLRRAENQARGRPERGVPDVAARDMAENDNNEAGLDREAPKLSTVNYSGRWPR